MDASWETCRTSREDSLSYFFASRRHNAVRGEEDWPVEGLELFNLLPPGIAVVPSEMVVLLECWVVMSRQHLTVSVNIDTSIFSLFEKLFQVV